jgi:hypothetical protein
MISSRLSSKVIFEVNYTCSVSVSYESVEAVEGITEEEDRETGEEDVERNTVEGTGRQWRRTWRGSQGGRQEQVLLECVGPQQVPVPIQLGVGGRQKQAIVWKKFQQMNQIREVQVEATCQVYP